MNLLMSVVSPVIFSSLTICAGWKITEKFELFSEECRKDLKRNKQFY